MRYNFLKREPVLSFIFDVSENDVIVEKHTEHWFFYKSIEGYQKKTVWKLFDRVQLHYTSD